MLRSMTGFGRCLVEDGDVVQQWEVRSVNSRYLDLKWRLPPCVRNMEARLEKVVREHARRGRVEISLYLGYEKSSSGFVFDAAQAGQMLESLKKLAIARGESYSPDYNALLHVASLWTDRGDDLLEDMFEQLRSGLLLALEDWNEARSMEGHSLRKDLQTRLMKMSAWVDSLENLAPAIKEERGRILQDRLTEAMASMQAELDENRFLQEIVILADRLDVSEELTRLKSHLSRLDALLTNGDGAGRRMDFTIQECFREINTLGNKIPDVQISGIIVDFKNELEQCREQVQNLE